MGSEWQVELIKPAQDDLDGLPDRVREDAYAEIEALGDDPFPEGSKRLRSGRRYVIRFHKQRYRMVYTVRPRKVVILAVADRGAVYDRLRKR